MSRTSQVENRSLSAKMTLRESLHSCHNIIQSGAEESVFEKSQIKFAVSKIVLIFAVQYRGIEQLVARRAHNPEAGGSSPPPATKKADSNLLFFLYSERAC